MDSPSSQNKTNKLCAEFPPVSRAQWEEVIQEDLKGADYEKKLIWQSPEGVKVKPYYTEEDVPQEPGFPGVFPFTRGNQPVNSWFIRQEISVGTLGKIGRASCRERV